MSLTVTRAAVRAKAGLDGTAFDDAIDALLAEQIPALAATLVGPTGAEADLGATEIAAAEMLDQLSRSGGAVQIGDLHVGGETTAAALRAQGLARLAPYQRDLGAVRAAGPR